MNYVSGLWNSTAWYAAPADCFEMQYLRDVIAQTVDCSVKSGRMMFDYFGQVMNEFIELSDVLVTANTHNFCQQEDECKT